jgi:hypothetical protein
MAGAQCRKCNGRIFGRPALTVAAWVGIDPCLLLVGIPNAVRSGLVPVRPKVGRLEEPSTDRLSRSAEEVAHRCVDVIVDGSVGHQACSVAEVGGPPPQHCVEPVTDIGPLPGEGGFRSILALPSLGVSRRPFFSGHGPHAGVVSAQWDDGKPETARARLSTAIADSEVVQDGAPSVA